MRYKSFGQKMTVPLDYIRVTKEQQVSNQKKRAQAKAKGAAGGASGVGAGATAGGK